MEKDKMLDQTWLEHQDVHEVGTNSIITYNYKEKTLIKFQVD
jgi:hypothetical protein